VFTLESPWGLPDQLAGGVFRTHTKRRLDPRGQGVTAEGLVTLGRRCATVDRLPQGLDDRLVVEVGLARRTLQRFPDDLVRVEWHTKELLSNLGHFTLLLRGGAAARHGGGRADAEEVVAAERLATAPYQQRHVRALPSTVGVQFVEHEKTQPLCRTHERAVFTAGEQKLQHQVVGEQDVRRLGANSLLFENLLLAGIAGEAHGRPLSKLTLAEKLPKASIR
jgi:hypothetical protein